MLFLYLLSIIQIVLESVPVSSSGHCMLLGVFYNQIIVKELIYLLHIPTIMVLVLFYREIICDIWCYKKYYFPYVIVTLFLVGLSDMITIAWFVIFGQLVPPMITQSFYSLVVGFCITTLLLFSLIWCVGNKRSFLTFRDALILGCVQGLALLPGISRFGAVYTSACWLGLDPVYAFHMTWLLQVPLMCAAVAKVLFLNVEWQFLCIDRWYMLVIIGSSFLSLLLLWLSYICARRHIFWIFAFYMIIPLFCAHYVAKYYVGAV